MQIQGETSVNKLIVLFVFDKMETALSERTVLEMCSSVNNWLLYMDCKELLPRLLDDGFICRISSPEEEPLFVITGEGRLDGQSCMGKAPVGVARAAKRHAKPVIAFSGCVAEDAALCNAHGIDAFFPILRTPCTLQEAMDIDNAARNLESTAEQALRLVKYFRK